MDLKEFAIDDFEAELLRGLVGKVDAEANTIKLARVSLFIVNGKHEEALSVIEEALANMKPEPAAFNQQRSLYHQFLKRQEECLRATGKHDEANAVHLTRLIPPRPEGISDKWIDLSDHYNAPLTDGTTWTSRSNQHLGMLTKTFVPKKGVHFDLRGIVHLDGRIMSTGATDDSQFSGRYVQEFPLEAKGIQANLKTPALHFLMSSSWGRADKDEVIANFVIHYADRNERAKADSIHHGCC